MDFRGFPYDQPKPDETNHEDCRLAVRVLAKYVHDQIVESLLDMKQEPNDELWRLIRLLKAIELNDVQKVRLVADESLYGN